MSNCSKKDENEFKGIELIGDQEIGRWQTKAKEYVDNPKKTENLLSRAVRKAENSKQNEVISSIWNQINLLFSLVRDWINGDYRSISKAALITIIAGLIYFVSPLDVVPDWLVGLGLVDDAAILGIIINQLDKELAKYKGWKGKQVI